MLYVVAGHRRTGTSAMMQALENGGMDACYAQTSNQDPYPDIKVCRWYPGDHYELTDADQKDESFPRTYDGKLIKSLNFGVIGMRTMDNGIKVIYMRRNAEEVRQSHYGFYPKFNWVGFNAEHYSNIDDAIVENIVNRRDVRSLNTVWYQELIDDPVRIFSSLKNNGWDIDVDKAAKVIDIKKKHYNL